QVHVKSGSKTSIETPGPPKEIPCPESGRLLQISASIEVADSREGCLAFFSQDTSATVNPIRIAINHIGLDIRLKGGRDFFERSRLVQIIGIQVCKDGTSGFLETFINCIGRTAILFTDPVRNVSFISSDNIDTAVSGTSIHDDVLQVRIALHND